MRTALQHSTAAGRTWLKADFFMDDRSVNHVVWWPRPPAKFITAQICPFRISCWRWNLRMLQRRQGPGDFFPSREDAERDFARAQRGSSTDGPWHVSHNSNYTTWWTPSLPPTRKVRLLFVLLVLNRRFDELWTYMGGQANFCFFNWTQFKWEWNSFAPVRFLKATF